MQKKPSLVSVIQKELFSPISIFWIFFLAVFYILSTLFLLNYRLVVATFQGAFPFKDKFTIFLSLAGGLFTAFSPLDTTILITSAFLAGINILLIIKTIYVLEHSGNLKLTVGGATIIGLISTGCSSCGFSVLSIAGLGASLSFLPFHGLELHILSFGFLLFSAFYMIKKLRDNKYCKAN